MKFIQFINEFNKEDLNKPANTDQIYYSELNVWATENAFRSFSVKYVLEGAINYKIGNKEFNVSKDHFLLAPKQPDVKAFFESREIVKSICIDISEHSINDALNVLLNEQKNEISDFNSESLNNPCHFENIYSVEQNMVGRILQDTFSYCSQAANLSEQIQISKDIFFELAESIIFIEMGNQELLKNLNALKASTKKEILKRIMTGKKFMDEFSLENPDIKTVAKESNMSEFQFYRSFKQAYGISPNQYKLEKRLSHANCLLEKTDMLISAIAEECSFPDGFTFSKAFKRKYGLSPSKKRELSIN